MVQVNTEETTRSLTLFRKLALTSVFAALYAVLVTVFAPISVLPIQVRFADALMPLAILFGYPAIAGLGLGAFVGNLVADWQFGLPSSSIGIDMVLGGIVNLVAGTLAWKLGSSSPRKIGTKRAWFLGTIIETVIIGLVVGSYLYLLLGIPAQITISNITFSGLLASIAGVIVGSVIAVNILGFSLLLGISRPQILKSLKSNGLLVRAKLEVQAE